ncbi:hypothetical protein EDC01DRAFT_634930 [Geopyxis carbonaria]|nr:hypothetical protein EDC01DRAFT_634930 [Geopyxis carbonaria]
MCHLCIDEPGMQPPPNSKPNKRSPPPASLPSTSTSTGTTNYDEDEDPNSPFNVYLTWLACEMVSIDRADDPPPPPPPPPPRTSRVWLAWLLLAALWGLGWSLAWIPGVDVAALYLRVAPWFGGVAAVLVSFILGKWKDSTGRRMG